MSNGYRIARPSARPLIGISAGVHDFGDYAAVGVPAPVHVAGGTPVVLPALAACMDELLDRVDAVVLAPGRDIEPRRYGQSPHPLLAPVDPRRDEYELELARAALSRGLPLLGICRGMQVLNVALGGTLLQDVRLRDRWREHPSDPGWRAWREMERLALGERAGVPPHPRHPIAIEPASLLADALGGATEAEVNSFHHQAVDELGAGLRATARAPDGVIEALELEGAGGADGAWVLAVQWELQEEWRIDARFWGVFEAFVAAAAARAQARLSAAAQGAGTQGPVRVQARRPAAQGAGTQGPRT
ncbi:MAG TPA: gamma-glutamyl-gamma-aminobutyrate hydrolase family protein [Solirubrobacteraceae bacterium]|nr:gamma-glutamyl-gamma-aminobutyrate hydrolase family protein [Solirubrobacteraceae bacterium]